MDFTILFLYNGFFTILFYLIMHIINLYYYRPKE